MATLKYLTRMFYSFANTKHTRCKCLRSKNPGHHVLRTAAGCTEYITNTVLKYRQLRGERFETCQVPTGTWRVYEATRLSR